MTTDYLTTGISRVAACPCSLAGGPSRWRVTFESANAECFHQLYADGKLVAWTDSADQRQFTIDARPHSQEVAVVACREGVRQVDAAALLGLWPPSWPRTVSLVPRANTDSADRAEVLDETQRVLAERPLWPAGVPLWSFGHDTFALGGFGFDGRLAPGLGFATFGAGEFGFDAFVTSLELPPQAEGLHVLTVRTTRLGIHSESSELARVLITPPPAPAAALRLAAGDPLADQITFEIER